MESKNIEEILASHEKWLNKEENGKRANLREADLSGADLVGADLRGANLREADLRGADLVGANLDGADLVEADLVEADLSGANLREADLRGADLVGANLSGADLRGANLVGANLSGADLVGANLRGADLIGANLREANLVGADLNKLIYDDHTAFFAQCCPEEGAFIGYKKANDKIIKLQITADAKRSSATSRKCRCSEAMVISITNKDGSDCGLNSISSDRDNNFVYEVGKTVKVENFDNNRWKECSTGIHFFITRDEAVNY